MHTFGETGTGVPAFLAKLWRLVDDPETDKLICWSKDGRSFIIQNQAQFARELLPLNYKHNNMASFIRQLNMYGFHKITSIDNGGLKFDRDEMEFSHPCFKRNCPYLLEHIKRKIANSKSIDEKALKPEAVSKVLQDVKAMRGRQDSLDSRFSVMKQENEALWREIAALRQKHSKQQQIVNKLIQFLITIVQPSRNMTSVKRHMQLMINDTPENAKQRTVSESGSECGPVIHELGEELLDEIDSEEQEFISMHHVTDPPSPSNTDRSHSRISSMSQNYDYASLSPKGMLASTSIGGNGVSSSKPSTPLGASIIQSVNPDGTQIIYHVTEVPDSIPNEASPPPHYDEDNVLTTPLVRKEMERTQALKQKNKHRRKDTAAPKRSLAKATVDDIALTSATAAKVKRTSHQQTSVAGFSSATQPTSEQITIKSEQDIDPMLFLNVGPSNHVLTPDPGLISPNFNDDSHQSSGNAAIYGGNLGNPSTPLSTHEGSITGTEEEIYNPDDFLTGGMPADLFEDNSIIAGDNSNFNDNFKLGQQQQYGFPTASNGKFSSFIAGNNSTSVGDASDNNRASTSAAAIAAMNSTTVASAPPSSVLSPSSNGGASTSRNASRTSSQDKIASNLAVTKYNKSLINEDIMRDEVSGHLENMQDELEGLKDLLRSDGYSLDANTLLGLFNDSDILGSYGLFLPADGNDKKGSELMSYQPMYDLSDIIDINDKNNLEGADSEQVATATPPPSSARQQIEYPPSALNTPYHE